MVEHYAELADTVVILISPLSRTTDGGVEISLDESKRIWEVYLENSTADINNVIIAKSPYNSPVQSAYELVSGNVAGFKPVSGDLIIPGASTKPDPTSGMSDINRFSRFHGIPQEKRVQGVIPANVEDYAFTPHDDGGYIMSARDFRKSIDNADYNILSQYIPDSVDPETILNIIYDGEFPQKKTLTMESLYSLVNDVFDKTLLEVSSEKQRKWASAQIDEGLKDFVDNIGRKAGAMLSNINKKNEDVSSLMQALGINYLDPNSQTRELLDTAEVLHDVYRFGASRALSDSYDKQLFDRWLQAKAHNKQKAREIGWETTGFLEEDELTENKPEDRLGLDTPSEAAARGNVKEMSAMAGGAVAGTSKRDNKKSQKLIREEE